MTGKELAEELLRLDPDGTVPVCINNEEIYLAEIKEAYWDGRLERHLHDPQKKGKSYSIIGGKICCEGRKIELHGIGMRSILENDSDAPIDLSELQEPDRSHWESKIEKHRALIKEVEADVEFDLRGILPLDPKP